MAIFYHHNYLTDAPMGSPVAWRPESSQVGDETMDNLRWGSYEENILAAQNDSTASHEPNPPSPFNYKSPCSRNNNFGPGGAGGGAAGAVVSKKTMDAVRNEML